MEPLKSARPFYEEIQSLLDIIESDPTERQLFQPLLDEDLKKGRHVDRVKSTFLKVQALVHTSKDAFQALVNGELYKFDPCVGDNGCFDRAVMLADFVHHLAHQTRTTQVMHKMDHLVKSVETDDALFTNTAQDLVQSLEKMKESIESSQLPDHLKSLLNNPAIDDTTIRLKKAISEQQSALEITASKTKECLKISQEAKFTENTSFTEFFGLSRTRIEDFQMQKGYIYIILTYLLYLCKDDRQLPPSHFLAVHGITGDTVDPQKLCKLLRLSKKQSSALIKILQKYLAAFRVAFVQHVGSRLVSDSLVSDLIQLIQIPYLKKDEKSGRLTMPCFASTVLLLRYVKQKKFGFFLNCKTSNNEMLRVYYKFLPAGGYSIQKVVQPIKNDTPVIVLNAKSSMEPALTIEQLQKMDLIELMIENDAIHPQYTMGCDQTITWPNGKLLAMAHDYFEKYKQNGQNGCSLENSSRLFISHIYSDTLTHQSSEDYTLGKSNT